MTSSAETYSHTEQEIVVLMAAWQMIDDMVNYMMFSKVHKTEEAILLFETSIHQRLFNILLVDFLSKPSKVPPFCLPVADGDAKSDHTILFYLKRICDAPLLNTSSATLLKPVKAFSNWLEGECHVRDVYLPAINFNGDLKMKRITFIKICGDIAKHNFLRLEDNVKRLKNVLADNKIFPERQKLFLALSEFYDWFHDDIFNYHGTTIAEHLNNIRWGIYEYLSCEFRRSFELTSRDPWMYKYNYPLSCTNPVAMTMYWDLMNHMLHEPYFPKFTTTKWLKTRY
ncbi:MAG: hypothetical protein H7338_08075 [Candidatus Sericytochromatia bacterium]|nr:hypothetical protein [Candidatus Sericytochromatia bacterium]